MFVHTRNSIYEIEQTGKGLICRHTSNPNMLEHVEGQRVIYPPKVGQPVWIEDGRTPGAFVRTSTVVSIQNE